MQKKYIVTLLTVAIMAGLTSCKEKESVRSASTITNHASAPVVGSGPNDCLHCHGPFNKLIEATANYVAPSGEKTSPHRYVPHDSKLEKDIPECGHCHAAHSASPLPAKGSIDLSKLNVEWCYTCHHEKNFKSCKDCHP